MSQGGLTAWALALAIALCVAMIMTGVLSSRLVGLELSPENRIWSIVIGFAFLCSFATASLMPAGEWGFYALPPLLGLFYFLPTGAAVMLKPPGFEKVFLLNLFLGWTVVGWVIALVWVTRLVRENASASPGDTRSPTIPPSPGKPE
jgi:Superinfection immunity protein